MSAGRRTQLSGGPTRVGIVRRLILGAVLLALLIAEPAPAGEYRVGGCQANPLSFATQGVFDDFATRGMKIKRACDPDGPGLRGLITFNALRPGHVPFRARAIATIDAPYGTRFTSLRWAGTLRRRDCRYALQLYAEAPDIKKVPIKNVRANEDCPKRARGQGAEYRSRTFNISGATRIVQRVICIGAPRRRWCSARSLNYVRTYKVVVGIVDVLAPTVGIASDGPLARGEWTRGSQALNYDASDNVGVRIARAIVRGQPRASDQRACIYADREGTYGSRVPCANGRGQISIDTTTLDEGTQELVVQAEDSAANVALSGAATIRVDNTPPARVDVGVAGGEHWRNTNDFALTWTNPPEGDRAPIVAASYKLCSAGGANCTTGTREGSDIAGAEMPVPAAGEWTVAVWRRDAAGNHAESNASVPVTLRYDPEPPQLGFEQSPASDPTLVSVSVTDKVSGMADGSIEISRQGSGVWQALSTEKQGSRLVTRIDDAAMPPGSYQLRARAVDQARNEGSTDRRLDGQPMVLTLPLRIPSAMQSGVVTRRVVYRTVRRRGKRRRVRQRINVLVPAARVRFGRQVQIGGRLTNRDGQPIGGAAVQVFARSATTSEQLVGTLQTDAEGRYRYAVSGTSTHTLRFVYGGSPVILPVQREVVLRVPAATSLSVSRPRVLNGQAVAFRGNVKGLPTPAGGKLVELQVLLSGRWQTFRTVRSDDGGRWAIRYRFRRTRGIQWFRFRARLPAEAGYPFEAGRSRVVVVRVRGR